MIKFCKKCLFPNTKPDLYFDDNDICDACDSASKKWGYSEKIDWEARESAFNEIINKLNKSSTYDCLVPVSGGKDSTWQAYRLKKVHKLRTLAITFDQFDQTDIGKNNLEVLKGIGIDHIHFTYNPVVLKRLVLKGLDLIGEPYWVNHIGMFTIPHVIAKKFDIPLIVYGENPQFEYGGPKSTRNFQKMDKRWRQEFGGLRGLREEDMVDDEISESDLEIFRFPETTNSNGIFYGDYFKWDPEFHTNFIIDNLGWKPLKNPPKGSYLNTENCDMKFIDVREHIKYLKYGYGRATDQLNILIRSNKIKRSDALKIVKEIDGKYSEDNLIDFCKYIDITVKKFHDILEKFVNYDLFEKTKSGWREKFERY